MQDLIEPHTQFCSAQNPFDIRLTTHDETSALFGNISAIMHEGGHALYEAGLPSKHIGTPLAESVSLGIHESQSRFYETMIGQGLPFWSFYYKKLQKAFPHKLEKVPFDKFYQAINVVTPSFNRVHSDEVTYILHVILRYEIEKEMLNGNLKAKDIPDVWNQKMKESFGIVPKDYTEGCLQDIHWSFGLIGYFPTYALGNIYAGQLFAALKKEHSDWDKKLKSGDILFLNEFMKEKIHSKGRKYSPETLIEKATNMPFSVEPYKEYLTAKYQ